MAHDANTSATQMKAGYFITKTWLTFEKSGVPKHAQRAGVRPFDGGVSFYSHRRTFALYAAYSLPKRESKTRSSGTIWKRET